MPKLLKIISATSIVLCLILFAAGCNTKLQNLSETIEKYNNLLRWGGVRAVTSLIEEDAQKDILKKKLKEMENKSVVEYALVDLTMDKKKKNATAIMQYSCIYQKTQSLKTVSEIQLWKYDRGDWKLSKIMGDKK